MTSQFTNMTHRHFLHCRVSILRFSYWSKFHVNIITGSRVFQISFIKDWSEIRKSEISRSEFYPISGDGGELGKPDSAQMSLMKCHWMLQKCQGYSFYHFWAIKEKSTGDKTTHPPTLVLNTNFREFYGIFSKRSKETWVWKTARNNFRCKIEIKHYERSFL